MKPDRTYLNTQIGLFSFSPANWMSKTLGRAKITAKTSLWNPPRLCSSSDGKLAALQRGRKISISRSVACGHRGTFPHKCASLSGCNAVCFSSFQLTYSTGKPGVWQVYYDLLPYFTNTAEVGAQSSSSLCERWPRAIQMTSEPLI